MPLPTRFLEHYRKADRIMLGVVWLMFFFSVGLAFWHDTFIQALSSPSMLIRPARRSPAVRTA
ncbi:hypothetical protein ACCD10_01295 [Pseudomonas sp. Pseusp122]|uniref:hypothetical protein n=1 Tax=unclassified Pseudomonas TaxID=196821 RepID=UPI0039A59417